MMWRFEAIDNQDVEIMMSRDTDTRILPREVKAVEEWINSNKIFHIMRAFHIIVNMTFPSATKSLNCVYFTFLHKIYDYFIEISYFSFSFYTSILIASPPFK